jgi:hypothetical protein
VEVIHPFVDYCIAFDIAGKGIADEHSLFEAVRQERDSLRGAVLKRVSRVTSAAAFLACAHCHKSRGRSPCHPRSGAHARCQ